MRVIYVMGKTCVGKSTLIERALAYSPKIGACEVGKEFRRRYPPGHFKGSAAPDHTEAEAVEIYDTFYKQALDSGKEYVLVDGQPRTVKQIQTIIGRHTENEKIWWLWCDEKTTCDRAYRRFDKEDGFDGEGYKLAMARIRNDAVQLYDVMWNLQHHYDLPCTWLEMVDNFNYQGLFESQFPNV